MQEMRIQEETAMKRTCGKTLTLTILAAIMAGTVPAWAEVNYDPDTKTTTIDDDIVGTSFSGGGEAG